MSGAPIVATVRPRSHAVARALATVERRPVLAPFVAALLARDVVATAVALVSGGSLFVDDVTYSDLAWAGTSGTLHERGAYPNWLYDHTAALLVPISGLYEIFGPVKLLGQLYVALLGAATAALTCRLGLSMLDRRHALAAGMVVALLPSQVLWSSLILKDAAVWAAVSALAVVVARGSRATGRDLAACAAASYGLLVLLGFLRLHTLEVALIALVLATLVSERRRRMVRLAVATAALLALPMAFGMGLGGLRFVEHARDPAQQRAVNAIGAESAVVRDDPAPEEPRTLVSPGTASPDQVAYLPKGLAVFALRPWPWERSRGATPRFASRAGETVLWYPLVALAIVGLVAAWRHRAVLAFPVLCGAGVLLMYGLSEGNLGTAYRHQGELVWLVAVLAMLGLELVLRGRSGRPAVGEAGP